MNFSLPLNQGFLFNEGDGSEGQQVWEKTMGIPSKFKEKKGHSSRKMGERSEQAIHRHGSTND